MTVCCRSGFRKMKQSNSEPQDLPHPRDFQLGSPESRAAARLLLKQWDDNRKWLTFDYHDPKPGQDPSRINISPWSERSNGDFMRCVYVPRAWRILPAGEANVPDDHVPLCPDCGTPFGEYDRDGILACFLANCLDRHDPAPPPKRAFPKSDPSRGRPEYVMSELDYRDARKAIIQMWVDQPEEFLSKQLNMHVYYLREFISGRSDPDAELRIRLAAAIEGMPFGYGDSPWV